MTVTSSSLLELSMSMLMERSISRWRLVTMPVGYVTLVRRPSLSYLGDGQVEMGERGEAVREEHKQVISNESAVVTKANTGGQQYSVSRQMYNWECTGT